MSSNTDIGGNMPPADAAFAIEIDGLFSLLSDTLAGGEVSNDDQETAIDALMDDFRKASKDADAARAAQKKPFDDAAKDVQSLWKPIIAKADRGITACKEALTPYRTAKQRAKDEVAAKARAEAEALQKAAQEALRTSDDLEAKFAAEIELEQAKKLAAVANKIDRAPTGLRTFWSHKIVNRRELLLHVVERYPDELEAMLNELVRQKVAAGVREIAGVEITEEKRAA